MGVWLGEDGTKRYKDTFLEGTGQSLRISINGSL
jgi:hypothetical protein